MDLQNLRKTLEDTILYHRMTAGEFAVRTGVSQSLISKVLTGKRPHISTRHLALMMPLIESASKGTPARDAEPC